MKYILEMPEQYQCLLVTYRDRESVCVHEDAMDRVTFRDNCKGKLNDRPDWCPLIEVKE